jgi:hypothetical protein
MASQSAEIQRLRKELLSSNQTIEQMQGTLQRYQTDLAQAMAVLNSFCHKIKFIINFYLSIECY